MPLGQGYRMVVEQQKTMSETAYMIYPFSLVQTALASLLWKAGKHRERERVEGI